MSTDGYLWLIELSLFSPPTVLLFFKSETKQTINLIKQNRDAPDSASRVESAPARLTGLLSLKDWEPCAPVKATPRPQKPRGRCRRMAGRALTGQTSGGSGPAGPGQPGGSPGSAPWLLPAALPPAPPRPHQREPESPSRAQNPREG